MMNENTRILISALEEQKRIKEKEILVISEEIDRLFAKWKIGEYNGIYRKNL